MASLCAGLFLINISVDGQAHSWALFIGLTVDGQAHSWTSTLTSSLMASNSWTYFIVVILVDRRPAWFRWTLYINIIVVGQANSWAFCINIVVNGQAHSWAFYY